MTAQPYGVQIPLLCVYYSYITYVPMGITDALVVSEPCGRRLVRDEARENGDEEANGQHTQPLRPRATGGWRPHRHPLWTVGKYSSGSGSPDTAAGSGRTSA